MGGVRRAFLVSSLERYLLLLLNFATIAIVSRLLTPAEIGLAVLGTSLLAVAETLRDFGTGSYLIQAKDVDQERIRTAFTVMAIVSALIVVILFTLSKPLASLYGDPRLAPYLQVIALAFLLAPVSALILALLRRDMAFGKVVLVNVASSVAASATTVALVVLGHSYMSFAWGALAWAGTAALAALAVRRDTAIFRFRLASWRSALAFGGYSSATTILNRFYEVLPYLLLGRLHSASSVGLFNRALVICQIPERALLSGIVAVALPALAAEAREGRGLAQPYLRALGYITVVQWPALIVLGLLAHPVVTLLLGQQWLPVVPLVQLMCIAQLFAFPAPLTYPVLVAAGAVRDTLVSTLVALPVSALVLLWAARSGVEAVVASMLLLVPLQVGIAVGFVRRRIRFRWRDLLRAIAPSAVVAAGTAAGPVAAIAWHGLRTDLPLGLAVAGGIGAALGWLLTLLAVQHPVLAEFHHIADRLRERVGAAAAAIGAWRSQP